MGEEASFALDCLKGVQVGLSLADASKGRLGIDWSVPKSEGIQGDCRGLLQR